MPEKAHATEQSVVVSPMVLLKPPTHLLIVCGSIFRARVLSSKLSRSCALTEYVELGPVYL